MLAKFSRAVHAISTVRGSPVFRGRTIYLTQVKSNQKTLLEDCAGLLKKIPCEFTFVSTEKGHGRIEKRQYYVYKLNKEFLDKKWHESQMRTLVVVEREHHIVKTQKTSNETVYWVSNQVIEDDADSKELACAVRNHWAIETAHNVRGKQFGEDDMICRNNEEAKIIAVCLSFCANLLTKFDNLSVIREKLASGSENIGQMLDIFFL